AFWLFHEYLFLQVACQECRHDIHLMDFQSIDCCDCEEYSDGCKFDHWCIGVEIVDAVNLAESSCHQSCFQSDNSRDFVFLVLESPFVGDDSAPLGLTNKIPSMILDQGVVFVLNCFLPLLPSREVVDDFLHCCWFVLVVGVDIPC